MSDLHCTCSSGCNKRIQELQTELEQSKEAYIRCKEVGTILSEGWRLAQADIDRLETGIRDHIGWADDAIDCDDLRILLGDIKEESEDDE